MLQFTLLLVTFVDIWDLIAAGLLVVPYFCSLLISRSVQCFGLPSIDSVSGRCSLKAAVLGDDVL